MVDKKKLIKIRNLSIGAITGALITGGPTIALASLATGFEYVDFPFIKDKCSGYEVTTKNFHIDIMKEGENEVVESNPKVLYLSKDEIDDLSAVSFKIYDQYIERIITGNSRIAREEKYYEYDINTLTAEEIDTIINQFKNGEFREISDNADIKRNDFDIVDYQTLEELDNGNYYSADLTIKTVNYDKYITITEEDSWLYNETAGSLLLIGAIIGSSVEMFKDIIDEEKKKM